MPAVISSEPLWVTRLL